MYLGEGTFCDTKSKVGKCFRQLPTPTECEESDSDFVYDPESPWGSPVPCRHTRSMGTPPPQLSPSGAAESSAESSKPEDTPPKPKSRRPRKPKCIVVKEKVYKIRQGARQSCKQCEFCKQKFNSQKELNSHVSGVHSFRFLCKKRTCGKEFSSKSALVKHGLCHQLPHYRCTLCGSGFQFQYQLKDHSNTHTHFQIKC